MINKEGKLFGKISIIDIIVVIVIIAVAAGCYMRFFSTPDTVKVETHKFFYTVRVDNIRIYSVDGLKQMGDMYDAETKEYLGKIVDVREEPAMVTQVTEDGGTVEVVDPEKYTVTLTVETDGSMNNMGYYTATNHAISVGGAMVFDTKYISTSGSVTKIWSE